MFTILVIIVEEISLLLAEIPLTSITSIKSNVLEINPVYSSVVKSMWNKYAHSVVQNIPSPHCTHRMPPPCTHRMPRLGEVTHK